LLSDLSERSPVLVVADDAQWLDRSSLDALAFAGSRLDAERVVLLVGARGAAPPAGFDRGFAELHLEPLSAADAGRLLDAQTAPPLAAVADGPDLAAAASHGAGPDARALAPAERLGPVKVDRTGLQFSHPLVRAVIYHSAPFAQRAAAHRQLAESLHDQPD